MVIRITTTRTVTSICCQSYSNVTVGAAITVNHANEMILYSFCFLLFIYVISTQNLVKFTFGLNIKKTYFENSSKVEFFAYSKLITWN